MYQTALMLETTLSRIADLEERAVAALSAGSEELAAEAAEAIAVMEADRDSIREARATFAREIGQLPIVARGVALRIAAALIEQPIELGIGHMLKG